MNKPFDNDHHLSQYDNVIATPLSTTHQRDTVCHIHLAVMAEVIIRGRLFGSNRPIRLRTDGNCIDDTPSFLLICGLHSC
jgi:hypothetical protein